MSHDIYASILPNYDVFATPPPAVAPARPGPGRDQFQLMGPGSAGPGIAFLASPAGAALRGLGQTDIAPAPPGRIILGLGIMAAVGALSYQVGKAIAPGGSSESTWGWIAVPVGLLTGPIGLGVMAIASNRSR